MIKIEIIKLKFKNSNFYIKNLVNPYKELSIYTADELVKYSSENNKANLPPHIFASIYKKIYL